jgi:hypothetical protein
MKFLQEMAALYSSAGANARLTDTQKSVLLGIYAAPTPETAYDATIGAENVTQARQQLRGMKLIVIDDSTSRAGVTDEGQTALANNNLIDDMGQLTDQGQEVLGQQKSVKDDFENATESVAYPVLRTLI